MRFLGASEVDVGRAVEDMNEAFSSSSLSAWLSVRVRSWCAGSKALWLRTGVPMIVFQRPIFPQRVKKG